MLENNIINKGLPLVTEYNDYYEKASLEEVLRNVSKNDPAAIMH